MNSHNTTKEIGYSVKSFETINTNPQSNFNFCNTYNSGINNYRFFHIDVLNYF